MQTTLMRIGVELLGNLGLDKEMPWNILETEVILLPITAGTMLIEIGIMGMEDLQNQEGSEWMTGEQKPEGLECQSQVMESMKAEGASTTIEMRGYQISL